MVVGREHPEMETRIARSVIDERSRPTFFTVQTGLSPVVATAIHNGHFVDGPAKDFMALDDLTRHREEDPYTGFIIEEVPNRLVSHRSRFALDLNRARERSVYLTPEDAWGLAVWKRELPDDVAESLGLRMMNIILC